MRLNSARDMVRLADVDALAAGSGVASRVERLHAGVSARQSTRGRAARDMGAHRGSPESRRPGRREVGPAPAFFGVAARRS